MNNLLERFLKYVKIDTMSDDKINTTPSTNKQFNLAKILKDELINLGLTNVVLHENCILEGTLKANVDTDLTIALFAHLDTIPDFSGTNVNPQVFKNYDGNDLVLKGVTISPKDYLFLNNLKGKTIITSDGTTVLGADDKAGIAIIISTIEYIIKNNIEHVNIKVCFTPDEEIGGGLDDFDPMTLNADFAYTVDGGLFNELSYENFNAASCSVKIKGIDIHPGSAKGHMLNASLIGMEFHQMLPIFNNPMYTDNYEGFNHLCDFKGNVTKCQLDYILRDHDINKLNEQIELFKKIANFINFKYHNICEIDIKESYKNMYDIVKNDMRSVNRALKAIKEAGYEPKVEPIRGGTDGAKLTYKGLITPNLGTGGYNCHGPYELACLEEMENVCKIIINILKV